MPAIVFERPVLLGLALVAGLVASSCTRGEGPAVVETRDLRPFSRLEVGAGISVVVSVGVPAAAQVRAQADILPAVATRVVGTTLTIEASDDFVSAEPVVVTVATGSLESVDLSGGARVTVAELDARDLALSVKGGSRVTLGGRAGTVTIAADGGSVLELADLEAGTVEVQLGSGVVAQLRATERVTGTASGGARLEIAGTPAVDVATSGGAEVSGPGA